MLRLRRLAPDAVFVSARTGAGLDALRDCIEQRLPRPSVEVSVLLPYTRGDLVARVHERGEILESDHTAGGTLLHARVDAALARMLQPYASAGVP